MNKLLAKCQADKLKGNTIPIGIVNGRRNPNLDRVNFDDDDEDETDSKEKSGTDYARQYIKEELERYNQYPKKEAPREGGLTDVDDGLSEMSDMREELFKMASCPDVFSSYNFEQTFVKKELPIDQFKHKVVEFVRINSVVVIQGPTGCGKTTQVPQYIMDDCRTNEKYCNIIITQPRKIATINIARRVCEERGWTLGTVCGYQVGLERNVSNDTIMTYVTTGVLLQKLISAKNLQQFTHIIIDEVHERTQELDFVLLVVRKFLFTNSPQTKVILMSATIDAEELAHYFRFQHGSIPIPAPIIYVDKKSNYSTHIYYADQLKNLHKIPDADIGRPEINSASYQLLRLLIGAFDKLDELDPVTKDKIIGSVLVFLPGINEIEEAQRHLTPFIRDENKIKWQIVPLHSSLPNDEQAKAFYKPKKDERKIILSTNIAESSITVPDIYYVVDFCLTKVMTQDPSTKFMCLVTEWASHVNCEQRAGRVGRVANGRVYRLVKKDFYNGDMKEKSLPEVLRAPLDRIVLQTKRLEFDEPPKAVLALALNPPNLHNIETTVWGLKESGGLLQTCNGNFSVSDGDITFLGIIMASLPIDVHLAKFIVLGHIFGCLRESIIIAAGCSVQNIFKTPFQKRFEAYKKQFLWSDGSNCDLISLYNLYRVWLNCKTTNQFADLNGQKQWCDVNFVSLKGLREWSLLITDLTFRLKHLGIEETPGPGLQETEKALVLKTMMCGAFYPNYFIRSGLFGQVDEREAVRTVGGRDPFRTVYLSGLDSNQPGQIYVRQVVQLMQQGSGVKNKMKIGFDGSSKIYVEFEVYSKPQTVNFGGQQYITCVEDKIATQVYEAVRRRQLRLPFVLSVLSEKDAWEYVETTKKSMESSLLAVKSESHDDIENYEFKSYVPTLPSLDTVWLKLIITWREDAANFWCQNYMGETEISPFVGSTNPSAPMPQSVEIERVLNRFNLEPLGKGTEAEVGKVYVARFWKDRHFYRAKVQYIFANYEVEKTLSAAVQFIDYGNIEVVPVEELCHLPQIPICHIPPLAMQCVLSNVKPNVENGMSLAWPKRVNEEIDRQTSGIVLYGKVYSVVNGIVALELFKTMPNSSNHVSLNQYLINRGYAVEYEESYLSQEDHMRRQAVNASDDHKNAEDAVYYKMNSYEDFQGPTLSDKATKPLTLKGPYSPLEMKICGVVRSSENRKVDIDGSSINTVLLDTHPQDSHARLLVSAYVGQGMNSGNLNLRQTSLMPNIVGFPMMMVLMFCPTMEPKLTEDGTRVASVLCGLGYHPTTRKPCFPQHDLVLPLDTNLTMDIMDGINKMRYFMNRSIQVMEDICNKAGNSSDIKRLQKDVNLQLRNLMSIPLERVSPILTKHSSEWDRHTSDLEVLKVETDNTDYIWPLLWFVKMNRINKDDKSTKDNLRQMYEMANKTIDAKDIRCLLCKEDKVLINISDIRLHLLDKNHKKLEDQFRKRLEGVE